MSCQEENHLSRQQLAVFSPEASCSMTKWPQNMLGQTIWPLFSKLPISTDPLLWLCIVFIEVPVHIQPPDRAGTYLQTFRCKAFAWIRAFPSALRILSCTCKFLSPKQAVSSNVSDTLSIYSRAHSSRGQLSLTLAILCPCWLSFKGYTLSLNEVVCKLPHWHHVSN